MSERTASPAGNSHTGLISEESSIKSFEAAKQLGSWRFTVRAGILITSLVALTNLGVLIWASTLGIEDGSATVFEGSCEETRRITFWVDLAINILSTLLLGASNNCTQLLVAPTRKDIDDAHAADRYLDVGVSSLRNVLAASRWRQWLCVCLFLTSVPLHLLYNSVIFSTLSASNYMAAVVTDDFLQGAAWNNSRFDLFQETETTGQRQLARLQNNIDRLTRLDNKDCIQAYGTNVLQSRHKNVLVVSDTNVTGPLIKAYYHRADLMLDDLGWICGKQWARANEKCDTKLMFSHATNWTITDLETNQNKTLVAEYDGDFESGPWFEASIRYCLAEEVEERCTVKISTPLLGTVLLCNLVKVACLACALLVRNFHPMATVGDLISSYLDDPDPYTHGQGPIAAKDVRGRNEGCLEKLMCRLINDYQEIYVKHSTSLFSHAQSKTRSISDLPTTPGIVEKSGVTPVEWKKKKSRWYQASSTSSWAVCMVLCVLAWSTGAYLLAKSMGVYENNNSQSYSLSRMWQDGIGTVSTDYVVGPNSDRSLMENVLLANTPQLAISFIYVFYNNCMTRMMLGQEYSGYAKHRKPLRVSRPEGEQRSTYRLQLPYRYSIPLMTAMAGLHWLVARSIFLVEIEVFDYDGNALAKAISTCGFSSIAIVLSLFVSGIIILALLANGARKLESGMPLASSCSLAITAACHTGPGDEDARLLPLKYGVVISEESGSDSEYEHVSFSSKEVTPLVKGHLYN
ncbi:hypothetical protein KCU73_g8879, partial [Aureobasidium melanogenum]